MTVQLSAAGSPSPPLSRPAPPPMPLLAAMAAFGPLSTDLYLPALPLLAIAMQSDASGIQLTLSGFLLAFAPAQLVMGPLADRFGRRPVLLAATFVFLLGSLACALAPSLTLLVLARILQALGACAGPVLSRAIIRDTFAPERAAAGLATIGAMMALAPAIGPIIGGWLTEAFDWRASFLLLAAMAAAMLLISWRTLRETAPMLDPRATDPTRLARQYLGLIGRPVFLGHAIISTGAYAGLFSFISGSSHVLQGGLGLSPTLYGLCFSAIVVGFFFGAETARRISTRLGVRRMLVFGTVLAAIAGTSAPLLLWLAGTGVVPILAPFALMTYACGLLMPNAQSGAIAPYPHMAGRVSALLGFLQWGIGAVWGLALASVLDLQGWAMAWSLAGAAVVVIAGLLMLERAR